MSRIFPAVLLGASLLALAQAARAVSATGGIVTTTGVYRIHTFTNDGDFTVTTGGNVEALVVAGGGGGGGNIGNGAGSGGGGGGGLIYNPAYAVTASTYHVVVGAGGAGGLGGTNSTTTTCGLQGSNSVFGSLTAIGGGYGSTPFAENGGDGGSGGGSGRGGTNSGGTNILGQGYQGGKGAEGPYRGGGGGGAGQAGAGGSTGIGGSGLVYSIRSGSNVCYAGGGGGGAYSASGGAGGAGGGGAGGSGNGSGNPGTAGTTNSGGGGGGGGCPHAAGTWGCNGGTGGCGIVIIKYYYPDTPLLDNAAGATNVLATTAWLNGNLTQTGAAATEVWAFWDTTDQTTNKAWAFTNDFGPTCPTGALTCQATSLSSNTTYYYTFYASNSAGEYWAQPSTNFRTMGPPAVNNGAGASSVGSFTATLNGNLAAGGSARIFIYWGTNTNEWANTNDLGILAEGAFSTNLSGLSRATTYYYQCLATNYYGTNFSAVTNFSTPVEYIISWSTNLVEAQSNLLSDAPVVVTGTGAVVTLNAASNHGTLVEYRFANLILTNGAGIVCKGQTGAPYDVNAKGVAIKSLGDLIINAGCTNSAINQGFLAGTGPGASWGYMGATHGGIGCRNATAVYGSVTNPTSLGSGSQDYAGGGAIKLAAASNLVINGTVDVAGETADSTYAGSAGGSIWITGGGTLTGNGELRAYGGWHDYGGGGGHIAIDDTVNYQFTGNIRAGYYLGSWGEFSASYYGGWAGTVYFPASARQNFLVVSNQTIVLGRYGDNSFGILTITNGGTLMAMGDCPWITYTEQGNACTVTAVSLYVRTNGVLTASGCGFGCADKGPGYQGTAYAGASHGGLGGNWENGTPAAPTYGSTTNPTSSGSNPGYYSGGSALRLIATGTLCVDGTLKANGIGGDDIGIYGAGAGGSIWITAGLLAGNGSIQANGGPHTGTYYTRGGGGGRIAIYYRLCSFAGLPADGLYNHSNETVSASITVKGGGYTAGVADRLEDGSIYIQKLSKVGSMFSTQ